MIAERRVLADVMLGCQRTTIGCLTRGGILGTHTRLETLTECERRRYEALPTRLAQKAALMRRRLPYELPGGDREAA